LLGVGRLTKAVPAEEFPVVAPVQNRPPTIKRMTHTNVMHELKIRRRPSLSVDSDHNRTASKLQQLFMPSETTKTKNMSCNQRETYERMTVPRKGSVSPTKEKKSIRFSFHGRRNKWARQTTHTWSMCL
jgi:hypothetical protein